jgi:hypothetical protein
LAIHRRTTFVLLLAAAAAVAGPAGAVPCALDRPPAATLLLPYFEVDLDGSATTLLAVGNATAESTLTRVTLWSDMGVPVLWFNVYLTGWDIETMNLRDVLAGDLPLTAPPGSAPTDTISPQGDLSEDAHFPGCTGWLPPTPLDDAFAAHLRAVLSGNASPLDGQCYGFPHGDGNARGYATVDVVTGCGAPPPGAEGAADDAALGADNVLWGDWLLVDPVANRASGAALLRLEADGELFAGEERTFYGTRFAADGADAREPLPSIWATRYLAHAGTETSTDLLYWRDPGEPSEPFTCGRLDVIGHHPWYVGTGGDALIFDEEENVDGLFECPILCPPPPFDGPFALHAGRVAVGGDALPVFFDFGWIWGDFTNTGIGQPIAQAWLGSLMGAEGRYEGATDGTPVDAPCAPGEPVNGAPGF